MGLEGKEWYVRNGQSIQVTLLQATVTAVELGQGNNILDYLHGYSRRQSLLAYQSIMILISPLVVNIVPVIITSYLWDLHKSGVLLEKYFGIVLYQNYQPFL